MDQLSLISNVKFICFVSIIKQTLTIINSVLKRTIDNILPMNSKLDGLKSSTLLINDMRLVMKILKVRYSIGEQIFQKIDAQIDSQHLFL